MLVGVKHMVRIFFIHKIWFQVRLGAQYILHIDLAKDQQLTSCSIEKAHLSIQCAACQLLKVEKPLNVQLGV